MMSNPSFIKLKFLVFKENHRRYLRQVSILPSTCSMAKNNWGCGLSALPVALYRDHQIHLLINSNPLPGGRNAVCCCNCMLARACWYWKIPVLKTAVAPLVFSRAGLFGNGGSTAWGIPCLVNEYKKQIPVKREKEKRKISWGLKLLGSMSKQAAEHLTTQGEKTSNKQKFKGKKKKAR